MQNFEIEEEGSTNSELHENVKKSMHKQFAQQEPKTVDSFDLPNCFLTTVFKILSITLYLVLKLVTSSYLGLFVTTVIIVSMDFWVTKNLTGRKLVGLRWWSQLNEDGEQQWIFESRSPNREPNSINVNVFWISLLVAVAFWSVILIINLITLSLFWIGLAFFCELLEVINFVCFFKCRGEHQKKAKELTSKMGIRATF